MAFYQIVRVSSICLQDFLFSAYQLIFQKWKLDFSIPKPCRYELEAAVFNQDRLSYCKYSLYRLNKNIISTNLHWEVIMRMVVLVDVTNCLFDHGKKWSECSQTSEIHNMLQSGSIFQRSFDQAIRGEKWHHWSCSISLDFDYGWNGFSGGVTLKN